MSEGIRPAKIDSIKGCDATIILAKSDFYPGEVVQGQLTLNVSSPVECQAFTLTLIGVERMHWETGGDDSAYVEKVHDAIKQEVSLLQPSQTALPVGQHVYPFSFPLPQVLPPNGYTLPLGGYGKQYIVYYDVYSCIQPKAAKATAKPKTVARAPFTIHAIPLPAAMYPGMPANNVASTPVQRCCFRQGTCEVTLSTDKDTCDIHRGELLLSLSIKNDTSLAIESLEVVLSHYLVTHIPGEAPTTLYYEKPFRFHIVTLPQVVEPHTTKSGIPLKMAEIRPSFDTANRRILSTTYGQRLPSTLVPTSDLYFASVEFRASVAVRFNSFLSCTQVKAELPVKLLDLAPSPSMSVPSAAKAMDTGGNGTLDQTTKIRDAVVVTDAE